MKHSFCSFVLIAGRSLTILSTLLLAGLLVLGAAAQEVQCFTLSYPAAVDVDCAGSAGGVAAWTINATPLCGSSVTVVCQPASGSVFPQGITTVHCTASDNRGNTEAFTLEVNVHPDRTLPVLKMPSPILVPCASAQGAV